MSTKFYEELIKEQQHLMQELKEGTNIKQNNQTLTLINNIIKNIYKYNQYIKDKENTEDYKKDIKNIVVKF